MMPDTTIEWDPGGPTCATPTRRSLSGTMHTDILSGACQGTLEINMTAERA
jgi:hypothetical protein